MSGFTKLFSSITESSIWCQDDKVLRVWVAMLARSNGQGIVEGSVPGFASLCRMDIEDFVRCVKVLSSPDPYSRTPDKEGRRIESVQGGWSIINYVAYREKCQSKAGTTALKVREWRAKKSSSEQSKDTVTCNQDGLHPVTCNQDGLHPVTCNQDGLHVRQEAEAEAEADSSPKVPSPPPAHFSERVSTANRKPASEGECVEVGKMLGMAETDARTWFRESEVTGWAKVDGTPFGNWRREMSIHRDRLRERGSSVSGTNPKRADGRKKVTETHEDIKVRLL